MLQPAVFTYERLAEISAWIDCHNADRSPSEQLWARVGKIGEEFGEVVAALISYTGQNPRKPAGSSLGAIRAELLDVAVSALGAVEHLTGNRGTALDLLAEHVERVHARAGL